MNDGTGHWPHITRKGSDASAPPPRDSSVSASAAALHNLFFDTILDTIIKILHQVFHLPAFTQEYKTWGTLSEQL